MRVQDSGVIKDPGGEGTLPEEELRRVYYIGNFWGIKPYMY